MNRIQYIERDYFDDHTLLDYSDFIYNVKRPPISPKDFGRFCKLYKENFEAKAQYETYSARHITALNIAGLVMQHAKDTNYRQRNS